MPSDTDHNAPASDRDDSAPSTTPLLAAVNIVKSFPGVLAVGSASLELRSGEIQALVGANGAGKSTLVKIMTGALQPDAGEIILDGRPVTFRSPLDAWRAGIATIYQEFSLVPALTVRENLFLGHERTRRGFLESRHEHEQARLLMERLGLDLDIEAPVRELSVAHQQLVEIARALAGQSRILIMDEPTAALTPPETERLFGIVRQLAAQGLAVVFISHRLEEVLAMADTVTIMRDGRTVETRAVTGVDRSYLVEQMTGRVLTDEYPPTGRSAGDVIFEVRALSGGRVHNVSFQARRGEVLGLAGLVGAGRSRLVRVIFGADRPESGEIFLEGRCVQIQTPRDAIRLGIALLSEDRKAHGLVLRASALHNFALPNLRLWSHGGWINGQEEMSRFRDRVTQLALRISGPDQEAGQLSGGNQQKLLVARWLEANAKLVIFDEPTRGVDAGARYDMYRLIDRMARDGKTIIVISSDFQEILGLCDRILVMRRGRLAGEIADARSASAGQIMSMAV